MPGGFGGPVAAEITLTGKLRVQQGGRDGVLEIKAVLAPDWHVYAIDQQGGPGPAKITAKPSDQFEVRGPFEADRPPQVRTTKEFDVPPREHDGQVTWAAPVRLAAGVDPQQVRPAVVFDGLMCQDKVGCKPVFGERVAVTFGGYYPGPAAVQPPAAQAVVPAQGPAPPQGTAGYRAELAHATLRGYLEPNVVEPGGKLKLVLTVDSDADWHVYAYEPRDPELVAKPTLIAVSEPADWQRSVPAASAEPVVKQPGAGEPAVRYHTGQVRWTMELRVPRHGPPAVCGWPGSSATRPARMAVATHRGPSGGSPRTSWSAAA